MKFSFPSFTQWRSGVIAALTRFPWNILCGVTGAACAIVSIHSEHNEWLDGQCARLAMTTAIGMPLFFSLRMLRERIRQFAKWPIEIVGVPLLALWLLSQPARPFDGPSIIWIRWLLLLAAFHFFVAVSAFLRRSQTLGFWQFNRRLFLRFCLATLYTGVLTVGLELALLSADKLFELKLDKAYGDLFFLMIGVFHPPFFLAGVPHDFSELDNENDYPRGLKAFTQFALAPLVAVYTTILYAYAIKIIISRSWPHGWVALPVLLLSGVGILAFLLLSPLRIRPGEKWAFWFTTNFPRALAPLSILLLLSVEVRVREYGVTEQRYIGLVLALWILVWALVFILRRNASIRWVPSSLAVIAFLTAFGPWSAGAISKMSQLSRLEQMLQAHGLWQDNHARPSPQTLKLSTAEETDFRTTLQYLIGTHGGTTVERIFSPSVFEADWSKVIAWEAARDVLNALRIEVHESLGPFGPTRLATANRAKEGALKIEGFRMLCRIDLYEYVTTEWRPLTCNGLAIGLENGALKVAEKLEGARQSVPIEGLLRSFPSTGTSERLPDDKLTLDFTHGGRSFRIVFDSIGFRCEPESCHVVNCNFYLLEK
jgi:Domain of unknown function (DUF4153)